MYTQFKSWQLFLILFGVLIVEGILPFNQYETLHLVLKGAFVGLYFHWMYSLSKQLHAKVAHIINLSWKLFNFNFAFVLIYIVCVCILFVQQPNYFESAPYIIVPLHLYAMFCMFYFLWFMAKSLVSIEIGKEAKIGDFIGVYFLFWFIPIGLWWFQPRVRRIFQ